MFKQSKKVAPPARKFIEKYLSAQLDFRARIFNILGLLGMVLGLFSGGFALFTHAGVWNVAVNFAVAVFAAALILLANRSGRFKLFFLITIITVFVVAFPILFFAGGGYHSGMPSFFIFAVVFTVLMLEGRRRRVFAALEILLYLACCLIAYFYPATVHYFPSAADAAKDIIGGCIAASLALAIAIHQHLIVYDHKQRELERANEALQGLNRMKTEFLANASHEMRTPLTVTSVNVQTAMEILKDMDETDGDPETFKLLQNAQNEIMRLSRMVGGMLTLASMSENTDRQKLDLTRLLQSGVEMLRLNLGKRGNTVETQIETGLTVFGNADLLAQVLTNILQNCGAHTENGTVNISAHQLGNSINIRVSDTGAGIEPALLSRVFERGVSTGGTGFGLYLCKTVVESHGGRIWIESRPAGGTTVHYNLPVYEGQYGGADI